MQAQLIEDEIGEAYFRALAHVDTTVVNPAHELLAELARQGRVGAFVTTNFDSAIEWALDSSGVACRLYTSPADFEGLTDDPSHLAVVNVHGSATQPSGSGSIELADVSEYLKYIIYLRLYAFRKLRIILLARWTGVYYTQTAKCV